MRIRLLALDLDGTVLTPERTIHPEHALAIREAHALGIRIVLASGRIQTSMRPFAEELGIPVAVVSSNGAYVLDENWSELRFTELPKPVFHVLADYADANEVHMNAYSRDVLHFLRTSAYGDEYAHRLRTIRPVVVSPNDLESVEIGKVLLMDDPRRIPDHLRALKGAVEPLGGRLTESEPEYLEFLAQGTSKATGLGLLAERWGILPEEAAAIGDYQNDLEMLAWAGLSGAPANGHPSVLARVDHVVNRNSDGGVAQFIREFVLR